MFAGPNGSGKSTLKSWLRPEFLGVFLNPDEIEEGIRQRGFLDTSAYGVTTMAEEMLSFFVGSSFLKEAGFAGAARNLEFASGRLEFGKVTVNSYFASVAADFLRQKLLEQKISFTFISDFSIPEDWFAPNAPRDRTAPPLRSAHAIAPFRQLGFVTPQAKPVHQSRERSPRCKPGRDHVLNRTCPPQPPQNQFQKALLPGTFRFWCAPTPRVSAALIVGQIPLYFAMVSRRLSSCPKQKPQFLSLGAGSGMVACGTGATSKSATS